MKNLPSLVLVLAMLAPVPSFSQMYAIKIVKSDYKPLEGNTILTDNTPWKSPWFRIDIPFRFHYFDKSVDSLYIGAYGIFFTLDQKDVITTCPSQATDRGIQVSESPISYQVSGKPGSRILKIEWRNIGLRTDTSHQDMYNAQLWIYENSEKIEIHIGPTSLKSISMENSSCTQCEVLFMSNYDSSIEMSLDNYSDGETKGAEASIRAGRTFCMSPNSK